MWISLLFDICFFVLSIYLYLLFRGIIVPQKSESQEWVNSFRKKYGWFNIVLLGLAAITFANIILRFFAPNQI